MHTFGGNALCLGSHNRHRHFFLSYVILQGFGIMPLQLLNLGVIIPSAIMRLFVTRTPRGVLTFHPFPT